MVNIASGSSLPINYPELAAKELPPKDQQFYRFARVVCRLILLFFRRWNVSGKENFPSTGGLIVVCNHVSYWDPVVVGSALDRQVHFMAKAELFKIPLLGPLIARLGAFPVQRRGFNRQSIKCALNLLRSQRIIGIFPEGTRSRTNNPLPPHVGAVVLALKTKVPILPVALIGTRGIRSKVRVKIGRPLNISSLAGNKVKEEEYQKISKKIMEEIERLINE
jgi:1-acyl-sn-glycerol-3-phosphate acyltransferase